MTTWPTDTSGITDTDRLVRIEGERAVFVVSVPLCRLVRTRLANMPRAILGTLGPYVELTEEAVEALKRAGVRRFP